MSNKSSKATATKRESTLKQVFALWKAKSKNGNSYFTGKYDGKFVKGFYHTKKKNIKEPDVKCYFQDENNELAKDPFLSLWCNTSKSGKKYLSGKLFGKRVIGFINEKANEENKAPYLSIYWADEQSKESTEQVDFDELPINEEDPF